MDDASGRTGSDRNPGGDEARRIMSIRERDHLRPHHDSQNYREPDRVVDRHDSFKPHGRDEVRPPAGMGLGSLSASAARSDGKRKRDVSSSNPSGNLLSGNAPPQTQLPDNVPPGKALLEAYPDHKMDIRRAGDYMCLWAWYYATKEQSEKRLKRLQSQLDQCKSNGTDFPTATNFISQEKQVLEAEIKRCCSRIDSYYEKFYNALMPIFLLFKTDNGAKTNLSGEPQQGTNESASKIKELEVQTAELKEQLFRERERNDVLENKVNMLARKFDESSNTSRQSPDPGSRASRLSEVEVALIQAKCLPNMNKMIERKIQGLITKDEVEKRLLESNLKGLISKDEVEKRLVELDHVISRPEASGGHDQKTSSGPTPGVQTAKTLRSITASMKALEQSTRSECSDIVGQLSLQIQEFKDVLRAYEGVVEKLLGGNKGDDPASSTADLKMDQLSVDGAKDGAQEGVSAAPCTDEQVKEMVQQEFSNLAGDFVPNLMRAVKGQLEVEQQLREAMAEGAGKMASTLMEVRTELDKVKIDMEGSVNDWGTKLDEVRQAANKVNEGLTWSHERIETLDSAWQTTNGMSKKEMEEVRFQVRNLQEWQNNFTTRPLYKDIVAHITETLPNGVWAQLRTLTGRMNDIQALLENGEGGDAKRRRIQAAMGNGSWPA